MNERAPRHADAGIGRQDDRWPVVMRAAAVLTLMCMIAWTGWNALNREQPRVSPVQAISIIDALPEPPEPEEPEIEEIEVYEPVSQVEFVELGPEPPDAGSHLDDSLGLDADGEGGGDSFGLKAKRGGQSVIELGKHGAGEDAAAKWRTFANAVVKILERTLNRNDRIRQRDYEIQVAMWLGDDGRVMRTDLEQTTGDAVLDNAIIAVLSTREVSVGIPPDDMPQPIRLRVRARGGG